MLKYRKGRRSTLVLSLFDRMRRTLAKYSTSSTPTSETGCKCQQFVKGIDMPLRTVEDGVEVVSNIVAVLEDGIVIRHRAASSLSTAAEDGGSRQVRTEAVGSVAAKRPSF